MRDLRHCVFRSGPRLPLRHARLSGARQAALPEANDKPVHPILLCPPVSSRAAPGERFRGGLERRRCAPGQVASLDRGRTGHVSVASGSDVSHRSFRAHDAQRRSSASSSRNWHGTSVPRSKNLPVTPFSSGLLAIQTAVTAPCGTVRPPSCSSRRLAPSLVSTRESDLGAERRQLNGHLLAEAGSRPRDEGACSRSRPWCCLSVPASRVGALRPWRSPRR